mmetsp:Transcript_7557/g.8596  ORF Transcript_7557/g.8596 Transcript_7557/m.8596 type:complete len:293 (+) Transcript_7557:712-1590(+)
MMSISDDMTSSSIKMYNILFPQLIDYNIGTENRRNEKNNSEISRVLLDFLKTSNDETSVYRQVVNKLKVEPELIFADCMALLIGGHETTFMSFSSAIYSLKKYPECLKNLMKEINEQILEDGKIEPNEFLNNFDHSKLDEMEYLTIFLKEVLRCHPPAVRSLGYKAMRSFKLRDILIPKGELIAFNILACHFSKDQWKEPLEFKPERFDPSSEYFTTPNGKTRHPLSYIPFTFGPRTCPGRSLAMLEIKVAVIYFLLKFEYEIDQEMLDNPDVTFSIYSPFELHMKITEVKF